MEAARMRAAHSYPACSCLTATNGQKRPPPLMSVPTDQSTTEEPSFIADILTPGSSRYASWQLLLDAAFAALLCVLLGLVWLTRGNIHIFGLIFIEICLYASIKWSVLCHFDGLVAC